MNWFKKKNVQETTEIKPQLSPQITASFLTSLNNGTRSKVKRIIEKEHITSKQVIMERCIGKNAPFRTDKVTMFVSSKSGLTIEFLEEAIKSCVNDEFKKYDNLTE